jgi:hypothetical protein
MKKLSYILILLTAFACDEKSSSSNAITEVVELKEINSTKAISTDILINGSEVLYDCFNCTPSYTDSVNVFAKKDTVTNILFHLVLGDFYFSGLEIYRQENEVFLLAKTNHTYGHSQSYLYRIDTITFKASAIEIPKSKIVIPDSLEFWKEIGLQLENNTFTGGASFRSALNRETYYLERELDLKKTKNNTYQLSIKNEQLTKEK